MATEFLTRDIPNLSNPNYLGNMQVVSGLLRVFSKKVLSIDTVDETAFIAEVKKAVVPLVAIFLGRDKSYPGPLWNTPGHIDAYLAKWCGVSDVEPEKRILGALIRMIAELMTLARRIDDEKLIKEQWMWEVDNIVQEYANLFLGLPRDGLPDLTPDGEDGE